MPVEVSCVKGNTILFEFSQCLKSPLCTSSDSQNWTFNTKMHHSVKTVSRVTPAAFFLCTSSDGAKYL